MAWIYAGAGTNLPYADRDNNSLEVLRYYTQVVSPAWDVTSIAALAGNMSQESTLNPPRTNGSALGLVQWISYKQDMIDYCTARGWNYNEGDPQCAFLEYQRSINQDYLVRNGYDLTWNQFAYNTLNKDLYYLTCSFKYQFERNQSDDTAARYNFAQHYYELFTGQPPTGGFSFKKLIAGILKPTYYLPFTRFKN